MFRPYVNVIVRSYLSLMRTARSILEAEMDTLVIHMDDRSTDFLKPIYEGKGYPVVTGPISEKEARDAIQGHARVFMLGHGGPQGLFTKGFYVDRSIGKLLAEKEDGLYIWCNADVFAMANKLTGLVSGMFISEVGEARMYDIEATQAEVDASNDNFSRILREILDTGQAHEMVKQKYCDATCKITTFNSERLYVFNHGNPSPALHPSSAHHRIAQQDKEDREWRERQAKTGAQEPQQADAEKDFLWDELLHFVEEGVDAVSIYERTPEEVAAEIARHIPGGEEYQEHMAAILQDMRDNGTDPNYVIQQILDQVGW